MDGNASLAAGQKPSATRQTILITGARAPVALHMTRLLDGAGHTIILADTLKVPVARGSKACKAYVALPSPRFDYKAYATAVEHAIEGHGINLVIPTCEEVFYLARIWRDQSMNAQLLAPPFDLLAKSHSKLEFIRLAKSLGLETPATVELTGKAAMNVLQPREFVFKPVWSRFASRVVIRPSHEQLESITPSISDPWIAQQFVDGDEISAYAVALDGRLKALALYRSLYRAGKGAGVCFEPVEDEQAKRFVEAFVAGTNWTGQISFDLMREKSGNILPLECNPRATSGLHFFTDPLRFADSMLNKGDPVTPDATGVHGVRLATLMYGLPQALRQGTAAHLFSTVKQMHDIFDWPHDRISALSQIRSLMEIAGLAIGGRVSLQTASTRDIEWNGPIQSSI